MKSSQQLATLLGSPTQVKWAESIRNEALARGCWTERVEGILRNIVDSTWWIANKSIGKTDDFKAPYPYQIEGGPTPPADSVLGKMLARGVARKQQPELLRQPAGSVPEPKHDAERFAQSVSLTPELAEIAILALMARVYKGPVADQVGNRARLLFTDVKLEMTNKIMRDIEGIKRILG